MHAYSVSAAECYFCCFVSTFAACYCDMIQVQCKTVLEGRGSGSGSSMTDMCN
jgi:hypothetical protein